MGWSGTAAREEIEVLGARVAAPGAADLRVAHIPQPRMMEVHFQGIGVPRLVRIHEGAKRRDSDRPGEEHSRCHAAGPGSRQYLRPTDCRERGQGYKQVEQKARSVRMSTPPHAVARVSSELNQNGREEPLQTE